MLHSNSKKHSHWLLRSCQTKGCEWDAVNQVGHTLANDCCRELGRQRVKGMALIPQHPDFPALQQVNEALHCRGTCRMARLPRSCSALLAPLQPQNGLCKGPLTCRSPVRPAGRSHARAWIIAANAQCSPSPSLLLHISSERRAQP